MKRLKLVYNTEKHMQPRQDGRNQQINLTMNGGGHSVLILGQTLRTMLVDKGKPLSGDKGTRKDNHCPKIRQGRMERV